jgi:hypothetical protein
MDDDETISRPVPGMPGVRAFTGNLERAAFSYAAKRKVTAEDVREMARAIEAETAGLMRGIARAIDRARKSAA